MNLFRKFQSEPLPARSPSPEPQPDAEQRAAARVRETSAICERLDLEQRSWQDRRNAAYANFVAALEEHRTAKEQLHGKTGIN
jgi:hypothetical protein